MFLTRKRNITTYSAWQIPPLARWFRERYKIETSLIVELCFIKSTHPSPACVVVGKPRQFLMALVTRTYQADDVCFSSCENLFHHERVRRIETPRKHRCCDYIDIAVDIRSPVVHQKMADFYWSIVSLRSRLYTQKRGLVYLVESCAFPSVDGGNPESDEADNRCL